MAAVATINRSHKLESGMTLYVGTIALDSTYPSAGEVIDVAGNTAFDIILCAMAAGYGYSFDPATQKLKVWEGDYNPAAVGPFVENVTTDLSGVTSIPFLAVGA